MRTKVESIRTKHCEIWLDEDGILWLKPDADTEMDLEEVKACFETYKKIGVNRKNKVLQIIDARVDISMNREGRDYAAAFGDEFFIASAVISSSLSIRLLINFFNMFYKSNRVPLKMFDTEENAKRWLDKFR